jgi:hypothetical protein
MLRIRDSPHLSSYESLSTTTQLCETVLEEATTKMQQHMGLDDKMFKATSSLHIMIDLFHAHRDYSHVVASFRFDVGTMSYGAMLRILENSKIVVSVCQLTILF